MLTYTFDLDIVPGAAPLVVHLKQYESGTILRFNLLPRIGELEIGAQYTNCKIRGTKSDGNGYSATAEVVSGDLHDAIEVEVAEQMTAVPGRQPFELTVTDSTGKMITATFIVDVQKAALDGTTITSESAIEEIGEFLVNHPNYIDRSVDNLGEYVADWLNEHPEATTTVPDHSIGEVKLDTALATKIASDATLLQNGRPADAYATGQRLAEVGSEIGVLANLNTSDKSNLVNAINEAMTGGGVVSVMSYGAAGDGITDDSGAIQDALDDLSGGGVIFFPKATYLIKSAVLFYSNQTLWFENGAVLKQGAAIDNLLRTYSKSSWTGYNGVHDSVIYGAIFDGGTYTTNNTLVGMSHAKNITIENCLFRNAYGGWHDLEINSSYNVKVSNCDFEGSRKNATSAELIQIDCAIESSMYPWSNVNYDGTVTKFVDISRCIFHNNSQSPAVGNHYTSASATNNNIRIHDCVFDNLTSSRGVINFESHTTDIDIYDNTFYFNSGASNRIGIGASYSTYFIHGNRFVNAATAVSGSGISHFNMINGTYTA